MKKSSRLSVALHAMVHLHNQPTEALTSAVLAECLMTNPVVIRRVLGALREADLVGSSKGHNGGWLLARPAAEITLRQIYTALGENFLIRTESDPGDHHCAIVRKVDQVMGDFLADAEALLATRLERVTLADIARDATAAHLPLPPAKSFGTHYHD